jgi:hypothetical protein
MRARIVAVATAATAVAFSLSPAAQAQRGGHVPQARPAAAVQPGGPVTVRGPHMWDPAAGRPFPQPSTVTVNQTGHLVNQVVRVSWTGFTPSSSAMSAGTRYPVMVAECKGAAGPARVVLVDVAAQAVPGPQPVGAAEAGDARADDCHPGLLPLAARAGRVR